MEILSLSLSLCEYVKSTSDSISPFHEVDHDCQLFTIKNNNKMSMVEGTRDFRWVPRSSGT